MDIKFHLDISGSGCNPPEVHVMVLGTATNMVQNQPVANGDFSYLDFQSGTLIKADLSGNTVKSNMVTSVDKLPKDNKQNYILTVPHIGSARLYISFGQSLVNIPEFTPSGPVNGKANTVIYDKIEFDNAAHINPKNSTITAPNPNVNLTSVDFYGLSYVITAVDANTGKNRSIGFKNSRADIEKAFRAIPGGSGQNGNPDFFKKLIFKDPHGHLVRILAPKAPGPADWSITHQGQVTAAEQRTHFWHDYINNLCYKPGRTFECYGKLWTPATPGPKYYGKVDSSGTNIHLFTDQAMTQVYAPCPTLPRPSNPSNLPDFSTNWDAYNQVDNTPVDWGFLISANTEGTAAPHWASNPVAMAIMISICRGCMHMDKADDWTDPKNWYTTAAPIYYYASILHEKAIDKLAYALSYDDIFGTDPSIYIHGHPDVAVVFGKV
ncbi:MAG: beta-1,3-glucanase family protein [Bacteroidota bacterium]